MMDALTTKLWGQRLLEEMQHETWFSILMPKAEQVPAVPPRVLTKRERLAQLIGEYTGYDGDPEGAADAVLAFMEEAA